MTSLEKIEQWQVGDRNIMIVKDELVVDDRSYGRLNPGVEVLVDHGKVFIGGASAAEKPGTVKIRRSR